jgi:hypothetical protein
MITIVPMNGGFFFTCSDEEHEIINKIMTQTPRKFERRIEEFLIDRKRNIREAENMLIMLHMSDEERAKRLKDITDEAGMSIIESETVKKEA